MGDNLRCESALRCLYSKVPLSARSLTGVHFLCNVNVRILIVNVSGNLCSKLFRVHIINYGFLDFVVC